MKLTKIYFSLLVILVFIFNGFASAQAVEKIVSIYDGDTFTLSSGQKVRLLQIDTPELASKECYGVEAKNALVKLLSGKGSLVLKKDPALDEVDRYGRILRYVFIGKANVNLELVKLGAAAPYFYKSEKGIYSQSILLAAKQAQIKSIGLWKKCPATKLLPNVAINTGPVSSNKILSSTVDASACDPNYSGCIPPYPPDLDCSDIKRLGMAPVQVLGKDLHKLDGNGDGVGCE
jgi:micrococcal nuclease